MFVSIILMVIGLAILTVGAELLVRGASALAIAMSISPLVVGLTVVAYGTGAPELVVSLQALMNGQTDITIGNVIGSNIFNILVTLGLAALIVPLTVSHQLIRFDVPLLVLLSGLVAVFSWNGNIGFWEGSFFTASLVAYTFWAVYKSRKATQAVQLEYAAEFGAPAKKTLVNLIFQVVLIVAGLGLLLLGARMFLDSAVAIAKSFGMSDLVIGLTLVAAGTSLPEVATSIMAAIRGERDIAVGNAIGSSLFNIMGVLGISGMLANGGLPVSPEALHFDIPVMIAVAFACLPIFFIGHRIERWEGGVFFAYYIAYTVYMVLVATESSLTRNFSIIMLGFVVPLTVITILIALFRQVFRATATVKLDANQEVNQESSESNRPEST